MRIQPNSGIAHWFACSWIFLKVIFRLCSLGLGLRFSSCAPTGRFQLRPNESNYTATSQSDKPHRLCNLSHRSNRSEGGSSADIPKAKIYYIFDFIEIIDIPRNNGSTDLSRQQRNTNIIVAALILRIEFSKTIFTVWYIWFNGNKNDQFCQV